MLWELIDKAYIAELWDLAFVMNLGCGDDSFMDFRAWLIGQGRNVYQRALVDPESLVDLVGLRDETFAEALLYVAQYAYESKTGSMEGMPDPRHGRPVPELKGTLAKDEESALAHFPKATEKFWNYWHNHPDEWFRT